MNSALGEAYYHARRFDVTIEESHKALELDPGYAIALVNIGRAYEQMGMHQQARDAFQKILAFAPDEPAILALMGHEYAVSGDMAHANQILARLTELSSRKYVPAVYFAVVYIGLGRKDDAFRWLDKAYDERCEYLVYLSSEPLADPLRGDPRFSRLLSRIGLRAGGRFGGAAGAIVIVGRRGLGRSAFCKNLRSLRLLDSRSGCPYMSISQAGLLSCSDNVFIAEARN